MNEVMMSLSLEFDMHGAGQQTHSTLSTNRRITVRDLWRQIVEDWHTHEKDWTRPGFRAIAVHRFGVWRMQIHPRILRAPFSTFYNFLFRHIRNRYGIELPYTVKLGRRVVIEHQHGIVIHRYSEIGDECIIRHDVTIGNRYMDRPLDTPKLGRRVNIGAGAKLLGAITIGDDVNIGANSVVLCSVRSNQTVVGIPAKPIKQSAVLPCEIAGLADTGDWNL